MSRRETVASALFISKYLIMSITPIELEYADLSAVGKTCFFCHELIAEDPAILWMGSTEIYLHPKCTVELTVRLLRDLHEIEKQYGYVTE